MPDLFDFTAQKDIYAVMGNPVSHSRSPAIHTLFATQTHQSLQYSAVHVDRGGFTQAIGNFAASGGKGLNITVPFKQQAWEIVEQRSQRAELAGAVNTIKFDGNTIFGDNTDGIGLVNDLVHNLSVELTHKTILLMGAGGAARGVIYPILQQQPNSLFIVNRTADTAIHLADSFTLAEFRQIHISGGGYHKLSDLQFDIIINATAASLQGECPPLQENILTANSLCYDMMYSKQPTAFMSWAYSQHAAHVSDGLGMLVEQAAESFLIWRGVKPETKPVIGQLREDLNKS